ncbi:hypothetical protein D3C80_998330 [compost metagenome]
MWCERVQHTNDSQQRFTHQGTILLAFQRCFRQLVHQFHNSRNCGVEGLATTNIIGYFCDSFVNIATQCLLIFTQRTDVQGGCFALRRMLVDQFPDAFQEAVRAFYA